MAATECNNYYAIQPDSVYNFSMTSQKETLRYPKQTPDLNQTSLKEVLPNTKEMYVNFVGC